MSLEQEEKENKEAQPEVKEEDVPEVQRELSKVATNPKQNILILAVIVAIILYLVFYFFILSSKDGEKKRAPEINPSSVVKPTQDTGTEPGVKIPELPSLPKLEEPKTKADPGPDKNNSENKDAKPEDKSPDKKETPKPDLPAAPLELPSVAKKSDAPAAGQPSPELPLPLPSEDFGSSSDQKKKEARIKSPIVLISKEVPKKTKEEEEIEKSFVKRSSPELLLSKGKIIEAVLESAVNTDFGGEVIASVSKDVFAENGRAVLIPKGSKIFGSYGKEIDGAYGRIAVVWKRIDLSSGYTLNIDSDSVDNLGRTGVQGRVDTKFKEKVSNAVLTSAFNIAFANALDKIVPPPASTQASASNTALATQLNNIVNAANGSGLGAAQKMTSICSQALVAITDKTSAAYTSIAAACNAPPAGTPEVQLANLLSVLSSASTTVAQSAATSQSPTNAQTSAQDAFKDVTDTIKEQFANKQFNTTVTIDQGTIIRIFVNKDYKFPKDAIYRNRVIK